MNDSILNDPGTKIDARPLLESGALRGAIVGFCWFLVVAVPTAWILWVLIGIGPFWGWIALGAICSAWVVFAVFAESWRTRRETFTAEQCVVFRRHLRAARMLGAGLTVVAVIAIVCAPPHLLHWMPIAILTVLLIWLGSSLLGWANGSAAVLEMQREARAAACRIDTHPLAVANDATPSALVQPSLGRFTETKPAAPLEDD